MAELRQKWITEDNEAFDTKAEANEHTRKPLVVTALNSLTQNDESLSDWLATNRADVASCFDTGSIKRVTKSERSKLAKAIERLQAIYEETGDTKLAFLNEHGTAIVETFRWPTQRRMTAEEKSVAVKNSLIALADGNEDLASWIVANEVALLESFDAGKEKRAPSENAMKGLADYRARKAAEANAAA
jgi:dsDNA-binding SOS-regulon protein